MTSGGSPGLRPAGRWCPAVDCVVAHSVLLAVAGLAVLGLLVLDDYGMAVDERNQRKVGHAAVNYILGTDPVLRSPHPSYIHRYYGVVFEVPLVLIERLLGLTDSRAIYLSRHLITHLCFLAGAGAAAGLVFRLFASRWLAVVAVAVLVLQPRLYAHSFFNTKDIPFLVAFLLGLALIQRACERERLGAFVLCGVWVGIATNLRIMGLGLFAAVVAVRGLDWVLAGSRAERQRVMVTVGGFVGAGVLTLYVVSPYLWPNPLEVVEAVATLSQHPIRTVTSFQGELVNWPDIPASYLPTWLGITTPPVVLMLSLSGVAGVLSDGLRHPAQLLRHTSTRFGVLLVACLLLPVLAVIVFNANVYNGWRQMYFLAAPLSLLAVYGLRGLVAGCPWPLLRAGVCVLAGAGLAGVVVEMVWIHPHQFVYFNRLVDRRTPDYLRWQYYEAYRGQAYREGLEYLLRRSPASPISLVPDNPSGRPSSHYRLNRSILPKADRDRLVLVDSMEEEGDFYLTNDAFSGWRDRFDHPFAPLVYTRQVYHNTILTVSATNLDRVDTATAEPYRQLYRTITAGEPLLRSEFNLYLDGNILTWVKTPCRPADVRGRFVLHIVPVDPADAAGRLAWDRERGVETLRFTFPDYGVRLDGACLIRRTLPYPIRALEARLYNPWGADRWRVAVDLSPAGVNATDVYQETYRAAVAGVPVARSHFDLYLAGRTLRYAKAPCRLADTRAGFFLQVFPRDRAVLGTAQRAVGFAALDFDFRRWRRQPHVTQVLQVADRCLAVVRLPAYPLAGLRTGQVSGAGGGWAVDLAFSAGAGPGRSLRGVPQ